MPHPTALLRPIAAVPSTPVDRSSAATIQILIGPDEGADRLLTRCFTLGPGGSIPCHRHPDLEHQQVILDGEMVVRLDGRETVARRGDALLIPAGVAHSYENRTAAPVRFLCMIPRTSGYATEWFEEG